MQQPYSKTLLLQNQLDYAVNPYIKFKEDLKDIHEKEIYYKKYMKYEKKEFKAKDKKSKYLSKIEKVGKI